MVSHEIPLNHCLLSQVTKGRFESAWNPSPGRTGFLGLVGRCTGRKGALSIENGGSTKKMGTNYFFNMDKPLLLSLYNGGFLF